MKRGLKKGEGAWVDKDARSCGSHRGWLGSGTQKPLKWDGYIQKVTPAERPVNVGWGGGPKPAQRNPREKTKRTVGGLEQCKSCAFKNNEQNETRGLLDGRS